MTTSIYEPLTFGELTLSGERPYLIAEAGVNHENDLDTALRMVDEAAEAGADAIKFQCYKAGALASRNSPSYWDLGKEPTASQYALFRKYDHLGDEDYRELASRAAQRGITFLSTPFDRHFADLLEPLMPAFKVASADLTNHPLLRDLARRGKPMLLSLGAATLGEVEEAVAIVRSVNSAPLALLHCVLSYPTSPADANLGALRHLGRVFPGVVLGYSDHVPPDHGCLALTAAWMMGARVLEKHFTLTKGKPGNDHYHAMDPDDIRAFREQCAFVTALVGAERKGVLRCEEPARAHARRSLVAARNLPCGHVLSEEDIAVKRPGTGIEPRFLELVLGCRTRRGLEEDEIFQWDAILDRVER